MARVRLTSEKLNCYGTWILTSGIDLKQYRRNPVLLWMHRRGEIIGRVDNIEVEDGEITGELFFDEVTEQGKIAKAQYEKGTLRMVSVNVDIKELSEEAGLMKPGQTRPTVTKSKLTEVSMVDIGGNDDAIVLSYQGKQMQLSADGSCDLPLLPLNTQTMDLTKIALAMGLAATATEAEILAKAAQLMGTEKEVVALKQEKETMTLATITQLVEGAITERKITAEKKAHFVELGKSAGVESLRITLSAMSPAIKPTDITGGGGSATLSGTGDWKKLSEVPSDKIMELRSGNPEEYKRLYRAEYGMECQL